ncbi:MAG: twin-arginine translocase subunit TatC [Deltaproteobacteria bacterium]|nr:twin-arginine translocase subunit TatC [Deltaproteobacteria bacterium]
MEEKKFIEHLDDLRSCLIRGSLGLIAGIAISFVFISPLFKILSAPYFNFLASQGIDSSSVLKSLGPADALSVTFKMALLFGFGLSSPWIAYQTWRFIGPALYKHEKKHVIIFCSSAAACFLLGVAFAYFLILPTVLSFFYRYSVSVGITPEWAITNYRYFSMARACDAANACQIQAARDCSYFHRCGNFHAQPGCGKPADDGDSDGVAL